MPLDHSPAVEALAFDDAPVEMRLPVLPPLGLSQEHRGKEIATGCRILISSHGPTPGSGASMTTHRVTRSGDCAASA